MAFKPISREYVQNITAPQEPAEKSWAERAKDDLVSTVGNFLTGAQQGYDEFGRTQDKLNDMMYEQHTPEDWNQASEQSGKAINSLINETVLPVTAFVPGLTIPSVAGMLYNGAKETYNNTDGTVLEKTGNAIRGVTYGPVVDMYNNPNLKQEFHNRPISTLLSGVMAAGQAVLPVVGARYGVKKAGNLKDELVSKVDAKLNEITDNPPLENIGIQGLDALDQLDAPNRGFRAATKEELKQTVMEQLEQIKAQKFDEANTQSYLNDMARQERESNALQAQKNEISGSVLFNPLDRMEVGADLPTKTTLGGQGKVLGEHPIPSELYLGEKPKPQEIIQEKRPRYSQPQERPFLPSAEQLIDERSINNIYRDNGIGKEQFSVLDKKELSRQIVQSVKNKDFAEASRIAEQIGNSKLADTLRSVKQEQPKNIPLTQAEKPHQELVDRVDRQVKLNSGFDPTGGRYDHINLAEQATKTALKVRDRIVNGVEDNRIIDNNSKGLKDLPPIKKVLQRAYQQTIDSIDPISRYDKEVYKSARLANGSAVGKAESMIKNQHNPNSFENITKPIHDKIDDFAEYMVAVRAKELHATGTMTGVSNAKIAKIIADAPREFEPVRKAMTKYSDNLVEMLVDSGMISEEHAINMFNKYESYAPMMKAFDGEEISAMFKGKGDLGKPIKNIEGSDSKVVNPIESILKNTYTFNMIAETNKVRQQVARLAEHFPDEIKILKNGESAEKGTGTFEFFVNGEKRTMQLEPRLFEAIASMDSQQAGIVVTVLSKPASWLRAGATISPEFMAKNLIRDTIGAGIVGKDFTPFVDSMRGLKSAWTKDADYWKYKEEGGALGHLTGLDRNHMQEMLDNYRSKNKVQKLATAFNPKSWLEVLRRGQELSEDATRIGYYKKRMSKGDSSHEAAFEARDLLDFGRSGNWTKEANKVSAFINVSLQGTDKLVRSFKERPLETAVNTMKYLILPSMAVWYMGNDNEQIKELPRYVRDMFWVVPVGDKLVRIPKPFEAGVLFATGTERTMEAMFGNSKTPYKGYGHSLYEVTLPNLLPTALIPLGEWWANKSFFTGQAIVPMKEQDLPDEMQYGPYTSNVAKFAGEKTGQSPRKIDNAIRGLTGGAGTAVVSGIDTLTGGGTNRPAQTLSDMPVVKAFIADPRKGQQSTQDFYDELDKYTKAKRAETVRNVKMTTIEKKNYDSLNNANTALKALNKEERKITDSTTLSPEAKRAKLDKIIDAQTKLVQASLKKLR